MVAMLMNSALQRFFTPRRPGPDMEICCLLLNSSSFSFQKIKFSDK
eukprot:XP_001709179.1 Hypothetical protein GL50803_10844 [Giardia lamblia ATCC 50803]